jgi:hypothetical protein
MVRGCASFRVGFALLLSCLGEWGCAAEHVIGSMGFGKPHKQTIAKADQLAVGDFDGDGHGDLVTQAKDGVSSCFYRGTEDGAFSPGPCQPFPEQGEAIFGHKPASGPAKLLRGNHELAVYGLDGTGVFQKEHGQLLNRRASESSFFSLDLDQDGLADLVVGEHPPYQIELFLSSPSKPGDFSPGGVYPASTGVRSVVYRDLNGDNQPELAVLVPPFLEIFTPRGIADFPENAGEARFSGPRGLWPVQHFRNGLPALLIFDSAGFYMAIVEVVQQAGLAYRFHEHIVLPALPTEPSTDWKQATADFDGDGEQELVLASPMGVLSLFRARDGQISKVAETRMDSPVQNLFVADLNQDSFPELLALSASGDAVWVFPNVFAMR